MLTLFDRARLKLTAFYLLIIMTISLSFSAFIYRSVIGEFRQRLNMIETRLQLGPRGPAPMHNNEPYFIEDYYEAKSAVLLILLYTNGVILVFSAIAGYFLAGRTLQPIEEAMEEQKRFISDASHELKTPLTSMQTAIEVTLRDKNLKLSDAKLALKDNLADIDQLRQLTENLLSLTRLQQSTEKIATQRLDLGEIIKSSIKILAPQAKKKKIKINFKQTSINLIGEPQSLQKLITIILDNAIKYSLPGGNIKLEMYKTRRNACISISDKGYGIAKEDLPHIFDRFYRADQSRSKLLNEGFGLGLSIAKKIVELHDGSIKVDSIVNKGTTFIVKLPL